MSANNTERGVYRKYDVARADGSSAPGGKHEHCRYFVLDLDHDPFVLPALEAYAVGCEATHPALAKDIRAAIAAERTSVCACRSVGECPHGPQTASDVFDLKMCIADMRQGTKR